MILSFETWQITLFSISVGLASTLLILPFGIALAWLFARKEWPLKSVIETAVLLPLVMPPVSTGLILLKIFGRRSPARAMALRTRHRNRLQLERRAHRHVGDVLSLARALGAHFFRGSESAAGTDRRHPRRFAAENFLRRSRSRSRTKASSPERCWHFRAPSANSARLYLFAGNIPGQDSDVVAGNL